ncbi:L,D-transpeptidase [Candidatus Beckwithbacteria bacterium CG10_big_fil_rev_8_21_14_0_10_34_10]|uniref:L,D-transpeptidase n=1 Tax=Candidatus Beckwithbacteria bacterium CG10_big_fil_rev_8_21_14_0_10_34_10 TaxID=1974495 RepID=A0A2H0W8V5_9BACT|nr:MAG: L,D-transpeptidase [Candidatus Beckwithbacteria bacterium CG10_big_fil_rev_8_21_14_0_10_34_10]
MKKLLAFFFFFLISFFAFKDTYIYPYFDYQRLKSDAYVKRIRNQVEENNAYERKDLKKAVFRSKKLNVEIPRFLSQKKDERVLSADSNIWVDINLSTQTLCLFHGGGTNCFVVSTGMPWTPTPTGTYSIWTKLVSTTMSGPGYYLPGVPYTMYFYKGYGIHGTYWHNNFGQQMSHGCVNMKTPEAQFVFDRVSVGTRVVVHY